MKTSAVWMALLAAGIVASMSTPARAQADVCVRTIGNAWDEIASSEWPTFHATLDTIEMINCKGTSQQCSEIINRRQDVITNKANDWEARAKEYAELWRKLGCRPVN